MAEAQAQELMLRWRNGDQQAAAELFRNYAGRLIALARSRLSTKVAQRIDPEDVVQSAYRSFFLGARDGRYDPQQGADLWQLLVAITLNKLYFQVRRNSAQKRNLDREQSFGSEDSLIGLQAYLKAQDPSVFEAVALTDQVEKLMQGLEALDRRMLELRLQGYNLDEIAEATGRSQRTVRRTLDEIKAQMSKGPFAVPIP